MARVRISEKKEERVRLEHFVRGTIKYKFLVIGIIVALVGAGLLVSSLVPHNVNSYYHQPYGPLQITNNSTAEFPFSSEPDYSTNVSVSFASGESVNYTLYTVHKVYISTYVSQTVYDVVKNGSFHAPDGYITISEKGYSTNYLMKFRANGSPANISTDATIIFVAHAQSYSNLELAGSITIFAGIGLIVYELSRTRKYEK